MSDKTISQLPAASDTDVGSSASYDIPVVVNGSTKKVSNSQVLAPVRQELQSTDAKLTQLSSQVSELKSGLYDSTQSTSNPQSAQYSVKNGSIGSNGVINSRNNNYSYSSPIKLEKNDKIVAVGIINIGAAAIALTDSVGSVLSVNSVGYNARTTYEYTAPGDCFVAICWKSSEQDPSSVTIYRANKESKLEKIAGSVSSLATQVSDVKSTVVYLQESEFDGLLTKAKINDNGTTIESSAGTANEDKYVVRFKAVSIGDCVKVTATNSIEKAIRYAFCTETPAVGVSISGLKSYSTTSFSETATSPVNGYFLLYYFNEYFRDANIQTEVSIKEDVEKQNQNIDALSKSVLRRKAHLLKKRLSVGSDGTSFSAAGNDYETRIIYLKKGDSARVTASNSTAKAIRIVYSSDFPSDGVACTPVLNETTTEVDIHFTAANDCYLSLYHYSTYFTNNKFYADNDGEIHCTTISLQGGKLGSNGYLEAALTERATFANYQHTPKYIKINSILSIDKEIEGTESVFCYDGNLDFIGALTASTLTNDTAFVKVQYYSETEYDGIGEITIYSFENDAPVEVFNKFDSLYAKSLSFEVQENTNDDITGSVLSSVSNTRRFDNGWVILPPNYKPSGEPVPLAIFWHGTNGYTWSASTAAYSTQMKFLAMNGYAVADCSGMTDRYQLGAEQAEGHDCRFNMLAVSCFCSLYKFLVKNYNLRTDGAYVFGKSNGGLGSTYLGLTRPFPIKCTASLAGSLSIVESLRYTSKEDMGYWSARLGMPHTFDYSTAPTQKWFFNEKSDDVQFVIDNVKKFNRIDPFLMMSDVDAEEMATSMFASGYRDQDTVSNWNVVSSAKKIQSTPMKIWHAVDDVEVPIVISRMYKKMVDNANGSCFIREIPSGYGGHHAVDNSSLAPIVSYKTKYNGVQQICATYAELVEWFNRW